MNYISILRLSIAFVAFSIFAHAQSAIFSVDTLMDNPTDGNDWGNGIINNFNGESSAVFDGDLSPPPFDTTTYFGPTFYAGLNRDSYKGRAGVTLMGYRIIVGSISPGEPGSPDGIGHNFKAVFMFDAEPGPIGAFDAKIYYASTGRSENFDDFWYGEYSLATYRPVVKADGEYYAGPLFSIDLEELYYGYSGGIIITNIDVVTAGATTLWTLMPEMESSNNSFQSYPGHPRNLTVDTSENATTLTGFTLSNITQVGFLLETTALPAEEVIQFGVRSFNAFPDSDGDGVGDNADAFDNDPNETVDTDGDGTGDNADAFPNDETETADADGDGVGDNADAFNNDPNESVDSDGDGFGDNADGFPNIPTQDIVNEVISNPSVYDLYSREGIQDLRTNSTILGVSNNQATIQIQMEESSNLESWNETGDAATMTVPADSDTKFYRFKMTE